MPINAIERKKVKSLIRVRLFATPWTVAHQAPLFMGFSRQEYWSGLPCPPPGVFPTQGSGGFFTTSATWEAPVRATGYQIFTREPSLSSKRQADTEKNPSFGTKIRASLAVSFLPGRPLFCLHNRTLWSQACMQVEMFG